MDKLILSLHGNITYYFLCGMIAASLFFLMAGIRELKEICLEGLLYLTTAFFFLAAHFLYLFNLPHTGELAYFLAHLNFWVWVVLIFAPALIVMFIILGLVSFIFENYRGGMTKIFFGLSLLCYIYMLGTTWPVDLKAIVTIVFTYIWFQIELETAR